MLKLSLINRKNFAPFVLATLAIQALTPHLASAQQVFPQAARLAREAAERRRVAAEQTARVAEDARKAAERLRAAGEEARGMLEAAKAVATPALQRLTCMAKDVRSGLSDTKILEVKAGSVSASTELKIAVADVQASTSVNVTLLRENDTQRLVYEVVDGTGNKIEKDSKTLENEFGIQISCDGTANAEAAAGTPNSVTDAEHKALPDANAAAASTDAGATPGQ
jgi:hypothetical protein